MLAISRQLLSSTSFFPAKQSWLEPVPGPAGSARALSSLAKVQRTFTCTCKVQSKGMSTYSQNSNVISTLQRKAPMARERSTHVSEVEVASACFYAKKKCRKHIFSWSMNSRVLRTSVRLQAWISCLHLSRREFMSRHVQTWIHV